MLLLFLTTALVGGTAWILVPIQLHYVPFEFAVAYRFILASLFLFLFFLIKDKKMPKVSLKNHGILMTQGIFFFGLNHIMCYIASQYIPTGLIAVTVSMMIIPNAILGFLFFKESISRFYVIGVTMGLVGCFLALSKKPFSACIDTKYLIGFSLAFGSTFLSATGTSLSKKLVSSIPASWITTYGTLYGGIFSLVLGCFIHGKVFFSFHPHYLMILLYVAVFITAGLNTVYFYLVEKQGMSRASYLWLIVPVISIFMSQFFEDFHTHFSTWTGLFLTVLGLYLSNLQKMPRMFFAQKKIQANARITT